MNLDSNYTKILKREFPAIDKELLGYVEGVLSSSMEDFESCDDVYDAIGDILQSVDTKRTENSIRDLCGQFYEMMKINAKPRKTDISGQKMLNAPINISELIRDMEEKDKSMQSIWVMNKENVINKIDTKKLEKAEAKLQMKLEKKEKNSQAAATNCSHNLSEMNGVKATASQMTNKKTAKLVAKGMNRSMDIRIENFDLAFGENVLLQNANLLLAFGRRYGLVGRNGQGKTTLLRMISERQLEIPAHITVLHVEQEVVGDDTTAIDSVLESETERTRLLAREKEIMQAINNTNNNSNNSNSINDSNINTNQQEIDLLNTELSQIYAQLEYIEADKAISKASVILRGLGFDPDMQKRPTKSFSGGWRMRLALARALFSRPDVLLLDEPTNMLDIKAIFWLEDYLQTWPTTLLVVSHDRNFLNIVPTDIIHLHSRKLDVYKGKYDQFEKTKTEKLKAQRREYEAQMTQRAHVQEFIDRFRYNANRAASVQSKIKMLDKLPEMKAIEQELEVKFKFCDVEPLNPPVLTISDLEFRYYFKSVIPTLKNINLSANSDSRICIVGANGSGKSTLLKIIIGQLTTPIGHIVLHRNLRIGYFSQHHVDQLSLDATCVELLAEHYPGRTNEEYRRQLGSFGITGSLALQSINNLSGGQKSRVALAKMCMAEPNFLILDEPTNHLDIETINALGKAINAFKGGVILVSHDERFISAVCKELWVCADNTVRSIEGGIEAYKREVYAEMEANSFY